MGVHQLANWGTSGTFDASGNEISRTVVKTTPAGTVTQTISRVYNAEYRVIEETDFSGSKRRMSYDSACKLVTQTESQSRMTRSPISV